MEKKDGEGSIAEIMGLIRVVKNEPIDLSERLGYRATKQVAFPPDFIDRYDILFGDYNYYLREVEQDEFHCTAKGCREKLLELYFQIKTVYDRDGEPYTMGSLAKDTDLYEALLDTNRKVYICLRHLAVGVFVQGEQKVKPARIIRMEPRRRAKLLEKHLSRPADDKKQD